MRISKEDIMKPTSIIKPKPKRLNPGQEALYRLICEKFKKNETVEAKEIFQIYTKKVLSCKSYWDWFWDEIMGKTICSVFS